MGERTRYEPGTFCWVGLATSDPDSAKAFYASMFGWEAEDLEAGAAGTYTTLRHGGKEVAILYLPQPEARAAGAPPHWTSYISVEDADVTAARAGELGGAAVFREPFDVRHYGAWPRFGIRPGRSCRSGSHASRTGFAATSPIASRRSACLSRS